MDAAIATLQMAARQLQISGSLEQSSFSRIMTQLRTVTDELAAFRGRAGHQQGDPIDFTAMLREAAVTANQGGSGFPVEVSDGLVVQGPADGLRDLLCCLLEYAVTVGGDRIELRAAIKQTGSQDRAMCATELLIPPTDVPDFLRRKLWDAVRVRRGEMRVASGPDRCRIEFTLPIERRLAAAGD